MVYVLLADGFEDIEAVAPIDILRRAGVPLTTVGVTGLRVISSHGLVIETDETLDQVDAAKLDMLVLPGGPGTDNLKASPGVLSLLQTAARDGKLIGAICAAPGILAELGLLNGRRAVCFPTVEETLILHGAHIEKDRQVTHDRNLVTARSAGSAIEFALKLVAMLCGWPASETVRAAIHYEHGGKALT